MNNRARYSELETKEYGSIPVNDTSPCGAFNWSHFACRCGWSPVGLSHHWCKWCPPHSMGGKVHISPCVRTILPRKSPKRRGRCYLGSGYLSRFWCWHNNKYKTPQHLPRPLVCSIPDLSQCVIVMRNCFRTTHPINSTQVQSSKSSRLWNEGGPRSGLRCAALVLGLTNVAHRTLISRG